MSFSYINQYFDHVYVVNLKRRPDRNLAMLQKLVRLGIQATFVEAIDGYTKLNEEEFQHYLQQPINQEGCHPLEWKRKRRLITSPGVWGNLKTFFRVIQDAKKHSYERILFFEDDAIFHKDFENRFKQATTQVPADWKILFLGATQHAWKIPQELRYLDPSKTTYDPHEPLYYAGRTDGAFALGLHRSVFDLISAETLAMDCPFDSGPLQEGIKAHPNKSFVLNPNLVIADVTESDIRIGKDQYVFSKKLKWDIDEYEFPFQQDLISVIIPAYNAEKTIEKTIRSILLQDYKTLELIVVDDASTDDTATVVQAIMQEDKRIRLISLDENKGISAAKNEGLKASQGQVIAFQYADELSLPTRLTRQLIPIYKKGMLFTVCLSSPSQIETSTEGLHEQVDTSRLSLGSAIFHRSVFSEFGLLEAIPNAEELSFIERLLFQKAQAELSLLEKTPAIPRVFERIDEVLFISPAHQNEKSNGLRFFPEKINFERDRNKIGSIFYPTLSLENFSINPEWRLAAPSRLGKSLEKELEQELEKARAELVNVHNSLSWKVTAPLRKAFDLGLLAFNSFPKKSKLKVVYFYHMPKCGGTYMLRLLKEFQKVSGGEFRSFNNLTADKKIPTLDKEIKQFIQSIKNLPKDKVMLIHHHHGYPGITELQGLLEKAKKAVHKRGGEMIICAMVRKPLPFSISLLNYTNRTTDENLVFQDIINKKEEYNHLSKYLLYNHPGRWDHTKMDVSEAEIKKQIQVFDYLFPIEEMQNLIALLNDFLGTKNVSIQKKINQTAWKLLPSKEEEEKIIAVNKLDQYLYDLAKEKAAIFK